MKGPTVSGAVGSRQRVGALQAVRTMENMFFATVFSVVYGACAAVSEIQVFRGNAFGIFME